MPGSWSDVPKHIRNRYRAEVFKRANNQCELKVEGTWKNRKGDLKWCTGKAEHVHHVNGVTIGKLDIRNMQASCANCNYKVGEPISKGHNPKPIMNTKW